MARILRKPDVLARIGVSSTTLWRMQRDGRFLPPFRISPGLVGWLETDVDDWIEAQRQASSRRTPRSTVSQAGARQPNAKEPRK